jgi:anti-sigma factor ChrR (cupin superfamily)
MSNRSPLDGQARVLAALFALDLLDAEEARAAEERYIDDTAFREEVDSLRGAAGELAALAAVSHSPRALWGRIADRIRVGKAAQSGGAKSSRGAAPIAQVWKTWRSDPSTGHDVVRGTSGFEPTSIAGIEALRLRVDESADRVTMLVRMAAGTRYPAHVHAGAEECFVVEGDLHVGGDLVLNAGDYQRMEPGTRHPVQSTRGGCLLFLVSSRSDRLEEGALA